MASKMPNAPSPVHGDACHSSTYTGHSVVRHVSVMAEETYALPSEHRGRARRSQPHRSQQQRDERR